MRNKAKRRAQPQNSHYLSQVLHALKQDPNKIKILEQNCIEYKQQIHLKRGFLRAIERLEWVIEASRNMEQFEQSVLADDYIGQIIRRYPLLFKGIKPQEPH